MRTRHYASLVLPTLALLALAATTTAAAAREAITADRMVQLAAVSSASAELSSVLSQERATAALSLIDPDPDRATQAFRAATAASDTALQAWQSRVEAAGPAPTLTAQALRRARGLLAGLGELRGLVLSPQNTVLSVLVLRYRLMIAALVDVQLSFVVAGAPTQIADRLRAVAAFSQASEAVGQQQIAVIRAIAAGRLTSASAGLVAAARSSYVEAMQVVDTAGDGVWRMWLDSALSGEDILSAQRAEGAVSRTAVGDPVPLSADLWASAQQARQDRIREVARRAEAQVAVELQRWRDDRARVATWTAGAAGSVLLVASLLAWLIARRMSRSLESLRSSAFAIAETGLPLAVSKLAHDSALTQLPAAVAADRVATTLAARGRDEIAQVAQSFNAIQLAALRLAAEQEQGKHRLAAMYLTVGLRAQLMLGRLVSKLDQIERPEEDPDRLAVLFEIDHLVSRMRLGNARLLLLGGKPQPARFAEPLPLVDVVSGALSQVDDYARINHGDVDLDLMVRPQAIADLVLALAELMNNACSASMKDSPVWATGKRIGDRAVVTIRDDGVGMSAGDAAHANALLAEGGQLNLPAIRWMGLAVVARVASIHGMHVRLRSAPCQGTTVEMLLPATVIERPAPVTHGTAANAVMALRQIRRMADPTAGTTAWAIQGGEGSSVAESDLPHRNSARSLVVETLELPMVHRDSRLRHQELSVLQASLRAAKQVGLITTNRMGTAS